MVLLLSISLGDCLTDMLRRLKERVIDVRKKHLENPWPPTYRDVGVVLVAHSMGGFVAADSLFLSLKDRSNDSDPPFPLIQGILTFDTPYNGLARSMFVYGAFSNYSKVSSVFNAMTALSAAAPASLSRFAGQRSASSAAASSAASVSGSSTAWQMIAVRTGTVGAIAAGGVAAYMHREAIMKGLKGMKNINKDSVVEGYHQSVASLGQGLAYINRGNVGTSFAWLSDHFTFVGSLMKQKELNRRLTRLAALKGVGVHDLYVSLGENGAWSGGYFVPERTFCAVPDDESHAAEHLFERLTMKGCKDEVEAHLSMFVPEKNRRYEFMAEKSADLVKEWFLSETPLEDAGYEDDGETANEKAVDQAIEKADKDEEIKPEDLPEDPQEKEAKEKAESILPDESPIDVAAAASLVPLPGSDDNLADPSNADTEEKRTYLQHLFQVAEQAGTGVKGWWPENMPEMPKASMPKMPQAMSSLGSSVQMPNVGGFWGKKRAAEDPQEEGGSGKKAKDGEEDAAVEVADAPKDKDGDVKMDADTGGGKEAAAQ
jgi:hypothetical protein